MLGVDLKVVKLPERLRDLYEADLALIRPDQVVALRGSASQSGSSGASWPVRSGIPHHGISSADRKGGRRASESPADEQEDH
jgi:hypothetical protein